MDSLEPWCTFKLVLPQECEDISRRARDLQNEINAANLGEEQKTLEKKERQKALRGEFRTKIGQLKQEAEQVVPGSSEDCLGLQFSLPREHPAEDSVEKHLLDQGGHDCTQDGCLRISLMWDNDPKTFRHEADLDIYVQVPSEIRPVYITKITKNRETYQRESKEGFICYDGAMRPVTIQNPMNPFSATHTIPMSTVPAGAIEPGGKEIGMLDMDDRGGTDATWGQTVVRRPNPVENVIFGQEIPKRGLNKPIPAPTGDYAVFVHYFEGPGLDEPDRTFTLSIARFGRQTKTKTFRGFFSQGKKTAVLAAIVRIPADQQAPSVLWGQSEGGSLFGTTASRADKPLFPGKYGHGTGVSFRDSDRDGALGRPYVEDDVKDETVNAKVALFQNAFKTVFGVPTDEKKLTEQGLTWDNFEF